MKRFELCSDLHFDAYGNMAYEIIDSWEPQTDILVIAGDLCEMRNFKPRWLAHMKDKWRNIVYVPGNHDYYGRNLDPNVLNVLRMHCDVLTRNKVQINGIVFAGATVWFPHYLRNRKYEYLVNDFNMIGSYACIPFYEEVHNEHLKDKEFFHWVKADVWVMHHLPFAQSIHPKYAGQQSNLFFYGQMEDVITDCEQPPAAIVHGHTHEMVEYTYNGIQVHCNPRGYPGEKVHQDMYTPRLIEVP